MRDKFYFDFRKRGTRGFVFPKLIARTLVGQERAPTETSRPLSLGADPHGRLQSFRAARPWLRLSFGFGPTVLSHIFIPRLQSGIRFALSFM